MSGQATRALLGIFVGGHGKRMGGVDKSTLASPWGGSLLSQQLAMGAALGLRCVLVGTPGAGARAAGFEQPAAMDAVPRIADDPAGIGPLGGLNALLTHAAGGCAIALACDMPFVDAGLLERLLTAPTAGVVAPRDPATRKWSPLCARYEADRCQPVVARAIASGVRSFQRCFAQMPVRELPLSSAERKRLHDWDRPEDMASPVSPKGVSGTD